MNSWTLFMWVRKAVFAFVALISLVWVATVSIYLSKQWAHSTILQRSVIVASIGVNALSSILLYLMIVVVFLMWKELLRVLFLLVIHTVIAVLFTLYGAGFSCAVFGTPLTCNIVGRTLFTVAWTIGGLLLGYTIYLCIMSRVPRPYPVIVPNTLLNGSFSMLERSLSRSSVNSTTGLLSRTTEIQNNETSLRRPESTYSARSQYSAHSKTVPKRLFVVNGSIAPSERTPRAQQLHRGASYGAMGSPQRLPIADIPVSQSRWSESTIVSTRSPTAHQSTIVSPAPSVASRRLNRQPTATSAVTMGQIEEGHAPRIPPRHLLLNSNPFMEPLSRHGTPETAFSTYSYKSAPANFHMEPAASYSPFSQAHRTYLTPHSIPPQLQAGTRAAGMSHNPFARMNAGDVPLSTAAPQPYVKYRDSPLGFVPRSNTATPSNASIHSLAPSLHFTNGYGQHFVGGFCNAPPMAHVRSGTDPIWRPYSAGARIGFPRDANSSRGQLFYTDVKLPNPYNHGADIRRYGSVPHVRSGSYGGGSDSGYGYYTAGYTGHGTQMHERGIARGIAAANDPKWRRMVMGAAGE